MSEQHRTRFGRRGFVSTVGAACGIAVSGRAAGVLMGSPEPRAARQSAPAHLAAGLSLGGGWVVAAIHPLHLGAVPVLLDGPGGRRVQVDVLRRDDAGPSPVATTRWYALHVANRGDGRRATVEDEGLAVMALARVMQSREGDAPSVSELLSHRQRRARHPLGIYSVG